MGKPLVPHNKAMSIAGVVLIISLGILFYTNFWWPGILLALLVAISIKEALRGRYYDMGISIIILGGLFLFYFLGAGWTIAIPVLFTIGGIWIIFREFFTSEPRTGEDAAEDASEEVSEEEEHEK